MHIQTRAAAARTLVDNNTTEAYIGLLTRILVRYGTVEATHEGYARFDLICTEGEEEVPEEWRTHYHPRRTPQDIARQHAWLTGRGKALHNDDYEEAASLVCDALCALRILGNDQMDIPKIVDRVEERFLAD